MAASADKTLSVLIKKKAASLGFDLCGIAQSRTLKEHGSVLKEWCSSGNQGEMNYLCRNIEKRTNPDFLLPGAKSVIVTGLNYFTDKKQGGNGIPVISKYAYGINYHDVIVEKLEILLEYIKSIRAETEGKYFVDSAPVLEKAWAKEAGLGWPGRHSIIINNKIGSFFFIGIIILNVETGYDEPFTEDLCGSCSLCISRCPTGAINDNRTIDTRKCIAYLTIESKSPVPEGLKLKMEDRIFGCDICQDVCPWNNRAKPNMNPEFQLAPELEKLTAEEFLNLTGETFDSLFKRSAIGRRTYEGFMRNVTNVTKSDT
jgi:epoxyqueuosine reductase